MSQEAPRRQPPGRGGLAPRRFSASSPLKWKRAVPSWIPRVVLGMSPLAPDQDDQAGHSRPKESRKEGRRLGRIGPRGRVVGRNAGIPRRWREQRIGRGRRGGGGRGAAAAPLAGAAAAPAYPCPGAARCRLTGEVASAAAPAAGTA